MARWKLVTAHYLFGRPPEFTEEEQIQWEYKEIDMLTGRERRKRFRVPFYFDAGTVVCHEGKGLESDYIFEGNPSHDMVPLDDEAKAIQAKIPKPMNLDQYLPAQGASASILGTLEQQLVQMLNQMPQAPVAVAASGVSKDDFEALQKQVAELMAQNAALAEKAITRRV